MISESTAMAHRSLQPTTYNLQPRSGFTLVEVMISVALVAVVVVAGFDLLWQVLATQTKSLAGREVQQNAGFALRRMELELRAATDVKLGIGESVLGINPGKLTLDLPGDGTDVVLDTAAKTISVGGSSVEIRKLRLTAGGGAPVELTSDRVDVTNFTVRNFTRGSTPKTIRVELSIAAVNPGGDANRRAAVAVATSVTLRR